MHLAYHLASACSLLQTSICAFVRVQTSSPFKGRRWEIEDRCVFYKLLLLVLILSVSLCFFSFFCCRFYSCVVASWDFPAISSGWTFLRIEARRFLGCYNNNKTCNFPFHHQTERKKRGESQNPLLKWRQSVARRVGKLCWLFEKVSSVLAPSGPVLFRCTTTLSHAVCISSESASFIIFFLPASHPQKSWNWIIVSSQQNNSEKKRKTFATSEGGETRRTQKQKKRK